MKKQILLTILGLAAFSYAQAQNVGIGINIPTAKLHVNQTAGVEAILVDHAGAGGNSVHLVPSNAANTSSTLWIENSTGGSAINAQMLTATSTASAIISTNLGTGLGLDIWQGNTTGATAAAIQVDQDGTDAFSRGVDIYMDAANGAIGYSLFHSGTGLGSYMELSNAASTATGSFLLHAGGGTGSYIELSNPASNASALSINHLTAGTGRGINLSMPNTTSTGLGLGMFMSGRGRGGNISLSNTTNPDIGWAVFHAGTGRGGNISLSNAASTAIGWAVFTSGTGAAVYGQSLGDGMFGISTGVTGTGGVFINNNPAADRNASGLFVSYSGTGGGTAGAGNSAEFQHFGTNGNAVDIFLGDPSLAPGPGNTISEYTGLSVSHMATGTSALGLNKTAISATNYSADPAMLVFNNGVNDGDGAQVFVTPNASGFTTGIYTQSDNGLGRGVGLWAVGGNYGVIGDDNGGAGYGIFSNSDFAAVGAKAFQIDYPLDPANKTLRHFCIESNEILNMYRGIVELDANGQATIELPEYFAAVNINPSYQLTAIGTATQPYVLSEIVNNEFVVAGAPNTKVSWTVHATRNDPTIRYFDANGANYNTEVREKTAEEKGKYFTPEAYGKDKNQGIFYDAAKETNYAQREAFAKNQKAMSLESKELPSNIESKENKVRKETNTDKTTQPSAKSNARGEEVTINK